MRLLVQRIEHLASLLASQFGIMERVRIELTAACTKPAPVIPRVSPAVLRLSRLGTDGVVSGDDILFFHLYPFDTRKVHNLTLAERIRLTHLKQFCYFFHCRQVVATINSG